VPFAISIAAQCVWLLELKMHIGFPCIAASFIHPLLITLNDISHQALQLANDMAGNAARYDIVRTFAALRKSALARGSVNSAVGLWDRRSFSSQLGVGVLDVAEEGPAVLKDR
jgi:hypothetical protein